METLRQLIDNYKISDEATNIVRATPIVLLTGITGAGKDSIKQLLLKTDKYHHIISHTARAPRVNSGILEQNGVEYHFMDNAKAAEMVRNQEFVEAKLVHDTVYGTSVAEIAQAGREHKIAITDLDVQGVAEYKAISDSVIAIFIVPPDYTEWQRRLYARYGTQKADPKDIEKRMRSAIGELEEALTKPYYHFVINHDLQEAVAVVDKIAHGDDSFNTVDDQVRRQTEELLKTLRSEVATFV